MLDRRQFLMTTAAAAVGGYAGILEAAPAPAASSNLSQESLRRFLRLITPDRLRARLYFIASDFFEGRDTGSFGQHATALYLGSEYVQLGFTPPIQSSAPLIPESFFQRFNPQRKRPQSAALTLSVGGRQIQTILPGEGGPAQAYFSGADFQDADAPMVFAGYGIE